MSHTKSLLFLIAGLSFAAIAMAGNGKIEVPLLHGYVTDAVTKRPVAGVVVSASLPGAINSHEVTTDADGYFHFAQLPASSVNLQFDKKGYQSYKRIGVLIKEKMSIRLNIEFLPQDDEKEGDDSEYPLLRMLEMN
jgi:hypothetical protein